jgi:hypothetical protein
MKRYLQLLGEMRNYQLSQAKRAVQQMEADDELVIVVPEQSLAETIQQWAVGEGYTVSNPKKGGEGMIRWHVAVQKGTQAEKKQPAAAAATPPA